MLKIEIFSGIGHMYLYAIKLQLMFISLEQFLLIVHVTINIEETKGSRFCRLAYVDQLL